VSRAGCPPAGWLELLAEQLGEPDEATRQALKETTNLDRLSCLGMRLLEVASTWQDLLKTP
jgi:hypothetical protein